MIQHICFLLKVKREKLDEYKARHAAVWPEMQDALRQAGWRNYSLFLRPDGLLVGYLETDDFHRCCKNMQKHPVNARWQAEMAPFFESSGDRTPDENMIPLDRIFHLD
jgi:L-rhamnose mutarotase